MGVLIIVVAFAVLAPVIYGSVGRWDWTAFGILWVIAGLGLVMWFWRTTTWGWRLIPGGDGDPGVPQQPKPLPPQAPRGPIEPGDPSDDVDGEVAAFGAGYDAGLAEAERREVAR